ncbi:MAG: sensor histidine kinase KdpD [Geminicoccaceae bacterium]
MPDPVQNGRPSPDALLELANAERRGRLKIFLGAAPGVGKTYEMLAGAQRRHAEGVDVVVGIVETHGRRETAALLDGLDVLPRRRIPYRGRLLEEMDLDALLARRPQLALVDELAHENAPGSRHPKRWMDVVELIEAGIGVWSTMNVQHVESLVDIVAQITRIRIRETVPDHVLDMAEIELIDLTPEDLRKRLHEGKVYVPVEAQRALDHYFSEGNLTALRELALRRTAERVDDQMVQYMQARGLAGPWAASDRLLVCVHGNEGAAELVRYTRRVADRLKAPWTALHVETIADRSAAQLVRDRISDTLRLAERLGADTLVIPGERVADEALAWARANNVTQIVIGCTRRSGWRDRFLDPLPRAFIRGAGDITVHVLPAHGETTPPKTVKSRDVAGAFSPLNWVVTILLVAAATGISLRLEHLVPLPNVSLVYLAPVLIAALWYGLWPALGAAALGTLAYNFFFMPPRYTFTVANPANLATLVLFSAAAVLISGLAARARERTLVAREEGARAAALYSFSKKIASVGTMDDLLWAAAHQIATMLQCEAMIFLPDGGKLQLAAAYPPEDQLDDTDRAAAEWCLAHDQPAGRGSDTLAGAARLFLPARTARGTVAVVGIGKPLAGPLLTPDERRLLDALLDQTAVAIERVQLARDIDASRLLAETERLRTALLTSLSHDIRTPLASILGTLGSLRSFGGLYDDKARDEILATAEGEAVRLNRFLENLLDMTRLEGGDLGPKREPVDLADLVGASLARTGTLLARHEVVTSLPPDLPLVRLDFLLMEQVLVNLLENAARYAPQGTTVTISASAGSRGVALEIEDEGPGIAADEAALIFDKFYRGHLPSPADGKSGTGLGLAVCKGFVEAMGGTIEVLERRDHRSGARFRISLPSDLVVLSPPAEESLAV